MIATANFEVNGRKYACPQRVLVAICLDGSADDYINAAMARGLMPNLQKICIDGARGFAESGDADIHQRQ